MTEQEETYPEERKKKRYKKVYKKGGHLRSIKKKE